MAYSMTGYPLDTLLQIAEAQAARGRPLDIILTYCHYTLQNTQLADYAPRFRAAGVERVLNASPLAMGLFRDTDPPEWHPASKELCHAARECAILCRKQDCQLADVALCFSMRFTGADAIVVGCCTPKEIDCALDHFANIAGGGNSKYARSSGTPRETMSQTLLSEIQRLLAPHHNVIWPSPPPDA
jgi:hypothetical protein